MKTILWTSLLSVVLKLSALGALYTYDSGFQNGGVVPDGNANGWSDTRAVSGLDSVISHVSVVINVAGGYNGDLYAYLSHNGILVPLLNRVGTGSGDAMQSALGYATAGFNNVTLDDGAMGGSIHNAANPGSMPAISYTPDGGSLASLIGNPNGNWTLFFADLANGGGSSPSIVGGWSLEIAAVPEPVNVALGVFGAGFLVVGLVRSRRLRNRLRRCRAAFVEWVNAV
jgi:hypothetical protein